MYGYTDLKQIDVWMKLVSQTGLKQCKREFLHWSAHDEITVGVFTQYTNIGIMWKVCLLIYYYKTT